MSQALQPYAGFFVQHLYPAIFLVAVIDAAGVPFPGRLLLVLAGALSPGGDDVVIAILLAAAGALSGDHLVFGLGRVGGERMQALSCRWTMNSGRGLPQARAYIERFGPAAIVLGRFAFTVRLFAGLLAGSGAMSYPRFALFDALGALGWAALLILLGRLLGPRATHLFASSGGVQIALAAVALTMVAVPAVRFWRRARARATPVPAAS